ncbi:MAG: phenylalanine--tRNA ligase subunit beta, partial [Bacteroidetes bacterium]|nr:phenylalanine--tRNA ligase subunit beta [Bacteroidota bacterium]
MKISYNWLSKYLDHDQSPEKLGEILTNTGLEVESITAFCPLKGGLEGLVVGEVLEKEKHPNADKLSICQVDVAGANILQIVCGAPNVAQGQKVAVALVDTTIYPIDGEAFTIKKSKIRGELSEGMLCAEDEIGLGYGHDGILILDEKLKPGTALAEVFEIKEDFIFEIGLTPNRSDAMSHLGVARDIAAALNATGGESYNLKEIPKLSIATGSKSPIKISIEDTEACPRYSGIVLKNLKVDSSPAWLQNELISIGIRPINNVVDVTNYVLKELGQALHAFDLRAIEGQEIQVKKLKEGTKFLSLDGIERTLSGNDLMICNKSEAMCMAGVFGGLKSGVKNDTTSIFLESAYFNSTTIRKTSTYHSLRTDAAQRYEKGADPDSCILALERACFLLQEIAGAKVEGDLVDSYPNKINNAEILLRYSRLEQVAGAGIELSIIKQILKDLDFKILQENKESLLLSAPLYRADVFREIDVIEEILRIYGFNNIRIPQQVKSTLSFQSTFDKHALKEKLAHILNGFGFNEIMTNSITQSNYYEEETVLVRLQNSMTAELDSLRASLIPEALQVIEFNINRKKSNLKLFEFGNIYNEKFEQKEQLAIFYTGKVVETNWASKGEKVGIFHLKGIVEA